MATKYGKTAQSKVEKDDARAQARHAEERQLGQEGDEPQAGDRDRPVEARKAGAKVPKKK
jgi:hypothetical protein